MQKKRIILKSIIKFFTKNLFFIFGILMLVLFSSATFTTLNNATNNLNASYEKIIKKGNIHDFVINERFTLGVAKYNVVANSGKYDPNKKEYSFLLTPLEIDNSIVWTNSYKKIYNDFQLWELEGEINGGEFHDFFSANKNLFKDWSYVIPLETKPSNLDDNEYINNIKSDNLLKLETITKTYMPIKFIQEIEEQNPVILRNFNSINISSNKQDIFYKVIESEENTNIDNIVLFEGSNFSKNNKMYSGIFSYYSDLLGNKDEGISIAHDILNILIGSSWSNKSYIDNLNAFYNLIKNDKLVNPWTFRVPITNLNAIIGQRNFKSLINNRYFFEKGYSIIFDIKGIIPITGFIDNKISYEAIVTPQFLEQNNKKVFPYDQWTLHIADTQEEFNQWFQSIDDQYKVSIDNTNYIIIGSGLSPDFIYPIMTNDRIIPNLEKEALIYTNNSGFLKIQDGFRNSETESMILGKFNHSVKNKNEILDKINLLSKSLMDWPPNMDAAFFADDVNNIITPSTIRVIFIPNILKIILLVSYFLTSFTTFVTTIIVILFIKRFIELNRVNLGILQANGYKKNDIIIPMIFSLSFLVFLGAIIGFILGFILQVPTMIIFQSFWTLPLEFSHFNIWTFFIFVIAFVLFYSIIVLIIAILSLKGDNVYLMKSDFQYKGNLLLKNSKIFFKNVNPLNKFRISLVYHSLIKLSILSIMISLVMTSLVFASSTYGVFDYSINSTFKSKNYKFDIELYSPTDVSGQYYGVPINNPGMTLLDGKYTNYSELTNYEIETYNSSLISAKDIDTNYSNYKLISAANNSNIKNPIVNILNKNGNWHLPSINDVERQSDILFLKNLVQNKVILDVSILGNNPWEIASRLMPINQKNYSDDSFRELFSNLSIDESTFSSIIDVNNLNIGTYNERVRYSDAILKFSKNSTNLEGGPKNNNSFKNLVVDDDIRNDYLEIDKSKIMNNSIILSEFLTFIMNAFMDNNLSKMNYNLVFNKIPLVTNSNNKDETYTNAIFKIKKINGKKVNISNNSYDLKGIKEGTKFINLLNKENENLFKNLNSYDFLNNNSIPIVINEFSANKFNLNVGSKIETNILNRIDRHTVNSNSIVENLVVVGINNTFHSEEFYSLQKFTNKLTGMDIFKKDTPYADEPFNGILSDNDSLLQITNSISSYSPSGLYIGDDKFTSTSFLNILKGTKGDYANLVKASNITGIELSLNWETNKEKEAKNFQNKIVSIYGHSAYVSILENIESTDAMKNLTNNIANISEFIQIFILLIIIIISIIIITLVIFMLIIDSLKISGMIKILGLKNISNSLSFMSIYFVAVFLGIIISIPLVFFVNFLFINIILNSTNLLLVVPVLASDYVFASISVLLFFFITFLINWRKIKKLDLSKTIK